MTKTSEFLRLLMANQKRIYGFILSLVPCSDEARDIFQDTVLAMWTKFDGFERGTSFAAWGMAVARFEVLAVRRRHARRGMQFDRIVMDLLQKESDQYLNQIDDRMQAMRVCVGQLKPRDAELVRMRYEEEMPVKSIAEQLGRTVQGVYKHFARIHDMLLACIRRRVSDGGLV